MKIICNSCGAQHWLSDMQVSRGGCNITCPNCSAQNYADASMVDPASLEPKWYYAVNEESVGPLSTQELEFSYQNGQITADSYVWRDGLSDWMALNAVPELAYLQSPVQGESISDDEATRVAAGFSSQPTGFSNFSDAPGEETAAIDLDAFKKSADSGSSNHYDPFGGSSSSGGSDFGSNMGSEMGSMPSANDLVGQRSENSVLFSLSSLQAVSAPPAASPSAAPASSAGLIDVKALASSNPAPRRRTNQPIDTFGGSAVPMGTVLPLGTKKNNTPLIIGLIVAGIVIVALFVTTIVVLSGDKGNTNIQQAQLDESKLAANDLGVAPSAADDKAEADRKAAEDKAAAEKAEADKKAAEDKAAEDKAAEDKAAEDKAAEDKAAADKAEADKKAAEDKAAADKAEADKKNDTKTDNKTATAKDTKKTDTKTTTAKDTKKTDTKTTTAKDTKKTDTKTDTKQDSGGGAGLTKDEIMTTIRGSFASVRTCGRTATQTGTMKVSFVIKGDGRVSNARVMSPEFANSATATCVLKVVNGLKFRATGKDTPINNYPFQIQK